MKELQLIRGLRIAQRISQAELASRVELSQSAIAHWERSTTTLSPETICKIAEGINLNPTFVLEGRGNPFKQRDPNLPIVITLPTDHVGRPNFGYIDLIVGHNYGPILVFLYTNAKTSLGVATKPYGRTVAIIAEDDDGNIFLFKGEKGEYFYTTKLVDRLLRKAERENKRVVIEAVFDVLKDHPAPTTEELRSLIDRDRHAKNIALANRLIAAAWSYDKFKQHQHEREECTIRMNKLGPSEVDRWLDDIATHIVEKTKKPF
jgi:transcriptional regulator with XRE-family HTH domain